MSNTLKRRVGLFDLEHMGSKEEGFVGSVNGSAGLIHCVSRRHMDLVILEARKHGVSFLMEFRRYQYIALTVITMMHCL